MGKGERRERGRMEVNIGVELGRYREYIYRTPEAYILVGGAITIPYLPYNMIKAKTNAKGANRGANVGKWAGRANERVVRIATRQKENSSTDASHRRLTNI
eukprot:6179763-Pleurochrysis_carterae.AAC.1